MDNRILSIHTTCRMPVVVEYITYADAVALATGCETIIAYG
jgi:hypothetical protein